MVKYTRLWETMQRKGISQYRLIKTYGISNGQLNRLRKNLYISTHTVETLCRILDCRVEDVMEIVFDESDELLWSPGLEEERQKQDHLYLLYFTWSLIVHKRRFRNQSRITMIQIGRAHV